MDTFYDNNVTHLNGSTTSNYIKFKETFDANKNVKDKVKNPKLV